MLQECRKTHESVQRTPSRRILEMADRALDSTRIGSVEDRSRDTGPSLWRSCPLSRITVVRVKGAQGTDMGGEEKKRDEREV